MTTQRHSLLISGFGSPARLESGLCTWPLHDYSCFLLGKLKLCYPHRFWAIIIGVLWFCSGVCCCLGCCLCPCLLPVVAVVSFCLCCLCRLCCLCWLCCLLFAVCCCLCSPGLTMCKGNSMPCLLGNSRSTPWNRRGVQDCSHSTPRASFFIRGRLWLTQESNCKCSTCAG